MAHPATYNPATGGSYAWLVRSSAFINFFYFYCVDADFGPFFLKFGTYSPYTAKLCLNGNEWAKRQRHNAYNDRAVDKRRDVPTDLDGIVVLKRVNVLIKEDAKSPVLDVSSKLGNPVLDLD